MASLKPSAAAMVIVESLISRKMPVSMGRDSSLAAANAVLAMAVLKSLGAMDAVTASGSCGSGGKSSGLAPLMLALAVAHASLAIMDPSGTVNLTGSFGRVLMNSVKSLAGMAIAPSWSMIASTSVLMVSWRFVPVREIPLGVVWIRMFWIMGMGALVLGTALLTVANPLARFSLIEVIIMRLGS